MKNKDDLLNQIANGATDLINFCSLSREKVNELEDGLLKELYNRIDNLDSIEQAQSILLEILPSWLKDRGYYISQEKCVMITEKFAEIYEEWKKQI